MSAQPVVSLRGFGPTFRRALPDAFRGKKAILAIGLLALPPLLALSAASREPADRAEIVVTIVLFLYLQFLVPLAGLLFGTGILLDESSGGNLPYLFTRPVPRSGILLGKYSAALIAAMAGLTVSLGATLLLSTGADLPGGFALRAGAAVLLALPAYLAAFAFLSALTRWALLCGFFYAFGLEGILGLVPGMVRKATLLFYSRSLLGDWAAHNVTSDLFFGVDGPAEWFRAVTTLGAVALIGVAVTLLLVRRKEFVGRNAGRA